MRYQIIFLPFWIINCSVTPQNDTEVFIKYSHSDVESIIDKQKIDNQKTDRLNIDIENIDTKMIPTIPPSEPDDIVFVPNDKPTFRNEDNVFNVNDAINSRRIGDMIENIHTATEKPNRDVLFISGKNDDNVEKTLSKKKPQKESDTKSVPSRRKYKNIDCTHLDCNNTVQSICGGRKDNNQWKYRLFLNECFFRKVNCGFQHVVNRYEVVSMEQCKNIGGHYPTRPYNLKPFPKFNIKTSDISETRRSVPSRRSLNMGVDGAFCDHTCPISCTEDHDPQCAVSNTGHRKVFLNHCKLDQNSCMHNVVWHRRPLSECVGGRKADMNQNRGFIAWMQRIGMIDKNGRLILN